MPDVETATQENIERLAYPVEQQKAAQTQSAMGASDRANQRAMRALRASLAGQTMKGTDGRMHGPLQPCSIFNFNPIQLHVGGQLDMYVPPCNYPGSKTNWKFTRGGRTHRAHYITFSDGKYYLSAGGHEDHVDLGWAAPTLRARCITPMEIVHHFYREYTSPERMSPPMGGVLIIDGDVHELDEARLKKSGGKILVPEAYVIPDTDGEMGVRLREADYAEELDKLVVLQVRYCEEICQKAYEFFNSKDPVEHKNVTAPMRTWGRFGVEVGYYKEPQPWMNENPDAAGSSDAVKICPVCRSTTTDLDAVMCGPCRAPYSMAGVSAENAVEAVRRGLPIAESFLDALDDKHHKVVLGILAERARRRQARESAAGKE